MEQFSLEERQSGIRNTVVLLVVFMVVLLGFFVQRSLQPRILDPKEMVSNGAIMFSTPREISPISVVDQNGDLFDEKRFLGRWTLVFFGFTHCPDICPTTLALFNHVAESLEGGAYADDTEFLFVTLDPARDTAENIKPYLNYFNPEFNGITGDFLSLYRFAKQLNVAFQKVVTNRERGDYTIDHGGHIALINPRGHYHGFFKPPLLADKIALTYRSLRMSD